MSQQISITCNGIWAGNGELNDGIIENCPAVLGGDQDTAELIYSMIEGAISDGEDEVTYGDDLYSWSIIDAD